MPQFINNSSDLVTSHKATVEGFLKQALAKTEKATPYSEAATKFHQALQRVQDIKSLDLLLDNEDYRDGLIAAAGISQKAKKHLSKPELDNSIKRVFLTLKDNYGEAFREEIVYRYLLTKGDTLGGSMRNYIGNSAKRVLSGAIRAMLSSIAQPKTDKDGNTKGFAWESRLLLFDVKPTFIGQNVDALLFDTSVVIDNVSLAQCYSDIIEAEKHHSTVVSQQPAKTSLIKIARRDVIALEKKIDSFERQIKAIPSSYLAGGELKGGIDPGGADEHWKTARAALDRIQEKFEQQPTKPNLFYVAAAIQSTQANEIYWRLQKGTLSHAANLTVPKQVDDLASWLVAL